MENSQPSQKSSLSFLLWVPVGLFVIYFLWAYLPVAKPPNWIERRTQRQELIERVQSAGGWTALQQDCDTLVEHNREGAFFWFRGDTNALPPTIAALKPLEVRYYSPAALRGSSDETKVSVVHIKIFGLHSTGGHSTPYFGLEVVSGTNADSYFPHPGSGGVSGNHYDTYRKVTNRIYEIY
jgi:hypothetical protein